MPLHQRRPTNAATDEVKVAMVTEHQAARENVADAAAAAAAAAAAQQKADA
jgi:hypothetical protein